MAETRTFLLLFGPENQAILKIILWHAMLKITSHLPQLSAALLDRQSIKQQVKRLQDHFIRLTYCTYKELVDKGISVHNVHAWLISLDVFRQREQQRLKLSPFSSSSLGLGTRLLSIVIPNYYQWHTCVLLCRMLRGCGCSDRLCGPWHLWRKSGVIRGGIE